MPKLVPFSSGMLKKPVTMLSFREKVLKFWSILTADGLVLLMISLPRPVVSSRPEHDRSNARAIKLKIFLKILHLPETVKVSYGTAGKYL